MNLKERIANFKQFFAVRRRIMIQLDLSVKAEEAIGKQLLEAHEIITQLQKIVEIQKEYLEEVLATQNYDAEKGAIFHYDSVKAILKKTEKLMEEANG